MIFDFWPRKSTFKVKFGHFLTLPHHTDLQNLIVSFEFLDKNLPKFVSLPWKLHNRYYHKSTYLAAFDMDFVH